MFCVINWWAKIKRVSCVGQNVLTKKMSGEMAQKLASSLDGSQFITCWSLFGRLGSSPLRAVISRRIEAPTKGHLAAWVEGNVASGRGVLLCHSCRISLLWRSAIIISE